MLESNFPSFMLSPWLAGLHTTADELGYFLHVEQIGSTTFRAICGDLEGLDDTVVRLHEQGMLTNQLLAHIHRRVGEATNPERAALGAFMRWHTMKIESELQRVV